MRHWILYCFLFITLPLCGQTPLIDSLMQVLDKTPGVEAKAPILNELAKNLVMVEPVQAMSYAKEAYSLAHQHDQKEEEFYALRWVAAASFYNNQPDSAIFWGHQFAQMARQVGDADGMLFSQKLLAYCSESLNDLDSAHHYFKEYYQLAKEQEKDKVVAEALNSLGVVAFNRGHHQDALNYYEQSKNRYADLKDTAMLALSYNNIGTLYRDLGKPDQAMEYLFKGLAIAEKSKNAYHINLTCHNIGLVHWDQKNYSNALAYLKRAVSIEDPQLVYSKASDYGNMGVIYFEMGNLDTAAYYYQVAREEAERVNNHSDLSWILYQQAILYLDQGKWESARANLEAVLSLSTQLGALKENIVAHYAFGRLYLKTKKPQKAIQVLLPSIALADSIKYTDSKLEALENLSKAYALTDNYQAAFDISNKYIALSDSLTAKEKMRQIAELETKYQTAQKDQELAQKDLSLAQKDTRLRNFIIGTMAAVLFLTGFFLFFRYRQRLRRQKAELDLQLEKAEAEKLRELDKIKSNFFANISHEFRTPLTLILGPLRQMREGSFKGNVKKYQDIMIRNSERLMNLVNQLLDLSKLESGKMLLDLEKADIVKTVRAMAYSFESLAERQEINFEVKVPSVEIIALYDQDKLEKVLINLLSNAFKFTPEKGVVTIEMKIIKDDKISDENMALIRIQDTGIGISPEQLPHVFERFFQTSATSAVQASSGIGLALTKELVELHKGEIEVQSELDEGTTFTVQLPIGKIKSEADVQQVEHKFIVKSSEDWVAEIQTDGTPQENNSTPLLLLVEDNKDVRLYVKDQLETDYRIIEAVNGIEGIEKAVEAIPDLIISDVMMPQMDGMEMSKTLKHNDKTSHIPIIMLTAKAERADKIEGLQTGVDDYLIKPFDAKELKVRIQNLIEQRKRIQMSFGQGFSFHPKEVDINSVDEKFLYRVKRSIEENLDDETFSVVGLGKMVGMSRSQLHRKLKALANRSPNQIIREMRLLRAKELLEKKSGNASEVAFMVGFNSLAYFSKCFRDQFGVSPSEV